MTASQAAESDTFSSAFYEFKNIPVFFGRVMDAGITQIQVSTAKGQDSEVAAIYHGGDYNRYWFAAFPSKEDGYIVTALDAKGQIISQVTYK
ncbi:hypothetical protein [Paenibacillus sp. CF384]|uniref:hypothetical protein n=1 Tax=Paenibacillus sp. CF384 TaxID=1884382 RepID=UPI0015A4F1ED|nr:hypothetical protein [Paenibacillus sp. CF384]